MSVSEALATVANKFNFVKHGTSPSRKKGGMTDYHRRAEQRLKKLLEVNKSLYWILVLVT